MNARTLGLLLLLTLGCGTAQACVCGLPGQPGNTSVEEWIEGSLTSDHVVLARVTEVIRTNKKPDLDQRAKIEPLEHFKGDAQFATLSVSPCHDFALKEGDVRVFFVRDDGMIEPCSDYRTFISDEALLRKLRSKQR